MRLRRAVDHHLGPMLLEYFFDRDGVADVPLHEAVVSMAGHIGKILKIPGIAQGVQVHHMVMLVGQETAYQMRADEASSACD